MKRVFLIVLDSVGIGEMPDAAAYGDAGANTLKAAASSPYFHIPNLERLGIFHLDGIGWHDKTGPFTGRIARMREASCGKDTVIGHWEIAGVYSDRPLPTYPNGFPEDVISRFCELTGHSVLCNRPYSGTDVIRDFGEEQVRTGALIVYTSADSVFQIAAHEDVVSREELYRCCEIARRLLVGEHGVGRVIARPFCGEKGAYVRTAGRHDYALQPPAPTMLDQLKEAGKDVIAVGKIKDIFAGRGITQHEAAAGNEAGMDRTFACLKQEFEGLCFVNLVDFDMLYGHRRDVDGYARALTAFDEQLPRILSLLGREDILMITADHGCDPSYQLTTDHTREYTPFLMTGSCVESANLGTRDTFADIAATVLDYFGIVPAFAGHSML